MPDHSLLQIHINVEPAAHTHAKSFIPYFNYYDMVIELGMGKGSKKKPMTKKERDERRKRRKEKRSKK